MAPIASADRHLADCGLRIAKQDIGARLTPLDNVIFFRSNGIVAALVPLLIVPDMNRIYILPFSLLRAQSFNAENSVTVSRSLALAGQHPAGHSIFSAVAYTPI